MNARNKANDAYDALDEISLDEVRRLPTTKLFIFSSLCAHWADLALSELGRRAQAIDKYDGPRDANPSDGTRGER